MCCHQEFPLRKTIHNLIAATAFTATGALVSTSMGPWGLGVFLGLQLVGLALTLSTVCPRCGYFGHRYALGAGKLVPLLSRQGGPDEFCKTMPQRLCIVCLAAVPVVGLVGAGQMLLEGEWLWPLLYLASMLAFALPHPRWMCRYCAQRKRDFCPIGRALVRLERVE